MNEMVADIEKFTFMAFILTSIGMEKNYYCFFICVAIEEMYVFTRHV